MFDISSFLGNITTRVKLFGSTFMQSDQEFLRIDDIVLRTKFDNVTVVLQNLFDNDPILAFSGNDIINQNTDLFINDIIPSIEKTLSKRFLIAANEIFKLATFAEFFPN